MGSLSTIGEVFAKDRIQKEEKMIVQESDLVAERWYVVEAVGQDWYRAVSPAFDTFLEACEGIANSPGEYSGDAYIRRWDGTNWSAVPSEE